MYSNKPLDIIYSGNETTTYMSTITSKFDTTNYTMNYFDSSSDISVWED